MIDVVLEEVNGNVKTDANADAAQQRWSLTQGTVSMYLGTYLCCR